MRRVGIGLGVLAVLVPLAFALDHVTTKRVRLVDRYARIEQECKNREDVVRVMGCPPGWYATGRPTFTIPADISKLHANVKGTQVMTWIADDCYICVMLHSQGGILKTWLVLPD